ncbi:MAG: bifunctional biotin--[acetyl-CoA-carboxylase] ligase/biotin operon repressor BirA [Xanthomonadales bacterium]|nr:bifunctional biotin--[acetyl-CoA-carboxylase] ligase/biotin operon repressor BirA [Xanthomonadales bacterium]
MNPQQLQLLQLLASANTVSGQQLGAALGISRNAVWKHLQKLREIGLEIKAVSGSGYQLLTPLELFDKKRILALIAQHSLQLPGQLILKLTTESSNDDLNNLPRDQHHGSVVIAEHQSAGRGSRGRTWVSPFGRNIYLSMGWEFQHGINQVAGLSLLTGLAVVEALTTFQINDARLKWPNDILRGPDTALAKLGGCLVEINGDIAGPCQATIGIGLNLRLADSSQIDQSWADLRDHQNLSRNALVAEIISQLLRFLPIFSNQGLQPFIYDWNKHHAYAGKLVHLAGPETNISGIATGIDEQGGLLVSNKTGETTIHSGEVSLFPINTHPQN